MDIGLFHAGGKSHHKMTHVLVRGFFIIKVCFAMVTKYLEIFMQQFHSLLGNHSEQNQNMKTANCTKCLSQCYNREKES